MENTTNDATCPCKSGKPLDECCGPFVRGGKPPPTAEALMRSRYSAYVLGEIDYVMSTQINENADRAATESWSREASWQGLEIVGTEQGGEGDDEGVVEFRARYELAKKPRVHHERSRFAKRDGRWIYAGFAPPKARVGPKVGRNDPCPCGSGKKQKKCHPT